MHAAICDFIADCLQNSIEAQSSYVKIIYTTAATSIKVVIEDNGKGMTPEQLEKAKDPFYTDGTKHVNRKVGLGIPFLLQALAISGGTFDIKSEKGKGTRLDFMFDTSNIDTPPEGDICFAVLQAMMFDGDFEVEFVREYSFNGTNADQYVIKRSDLFEILGDLSSAENINLARRYFESQEENLNKEAVNG